MEGFHSNPNEALTAMYIGDRLVLVPVIDYYKYRDNPEAAMAHYALEQTVEIIDETNT